MSDERLMSTRAASSLKLGLLSFACNALTAIPAVVQGVRGLYDIRREPGRLRGRAVALAGITAALAGTAFGVALVMWQVERVQEAAERMH